MKEANEQALEDFKNGKTVGSYVSSDGGDHWESAAYSNSVGVVENNGIDVVGDVDYDHLLVVETQGVRDVDAEIPGREYLDEVQEYDVKVEVYDRGLGSEPAQEETTTLLSGGPSQTSAEVWAAHAVQNALSDSSVATVEGNGSSEGSGEIIDLMAEEAEDDSIDVIR